MVAGVSGDDQSSLKLSSVKERPLEIISVGLLLLNH